MDLSQVGKGAGITFSGTMIGKGLLIVYTLLLARVLSTTELGIYFLGMTIVRTLAIIATLGLGAGLVRHVAIYQGKGDFSKIKGTVLFAAKITLLNSIALVLLVWLTGDIIATRFFGKPELSVILKALAISIPFEVLMRIFLASTRGLKLMQYAAYTEHIGWIGSRFTFAVVMVVVIDMGLQGVVFAYVASSVFAAVLAFGFANRHIPLLDRTIRGSHESGKLLRFSVPMVFTAMLHDLMTHIDIFMLGLFASASALGIYSVSVRMVNLAKIVFMAFQPIFQPFVAEFYDRKEFERLSWLLKTLTHWSVILSLPVFLSLIFFPCLFLALFNKELLVGSSCLAMLAGAYMLSTISNLPSAMIFMSGRSDITLKNNLIVLILNVILNYCLIPVYGIVGAALATGFSLVFLAAIRIVEVYRLMGIHPFRRSLWKPALAGAFSIFLTAIVVQLFSFEKYFFGWAGLALFWLIYLLLVWAFRFSEEELYVKDLIKKKMLTFATKGTAVR